MNTLTHRLDHWGESLGHSLRRLSMAIAPLLTALERWAARPAGHASARDDDIGWDDGEPEPRH